MVMLVTPPINCSGVYIAREPYTLPSGAVYRCYAIRTLAELIARGVDPYKEFYKPKNISDTDYRRDLDAKASIVTLLGGDNSYTYIPNSYIDSYPGMTGIDYERKILIVELGILPKSLNIDYLLPSVESLVTQSVGVTSKANVGLVPHTGNIDHQQHVQLEATRRAKMNEHVTQQEQIITLSEQNAHLQQLVKDLQTIIASYPEMGG